MLELNLLRKPIISRGSAIFTTPGTYDFIVPAGVTLLCGVGIGAGGGAWQNLTSTTSTWGSSGGGGDLGWKNAIPVVPGEHLIVVVGALGLSVSGTAIGTNGGDTYLARSSTRLFAGLGGHCGGATGSDQTTAGKGGGFLGDGGATGGNGISYDYAAGGGGGAAGYTGNGGNGQDISNPTAGLGGGGSGGRGGTNYTDTGAAGRGGGTGLFGLGPSGIVQATRWGNGLPGSQFTGSGEFGAGSGSSRGVTNIPGLDGGLRLIWGKNRVYPSTDVGAD